MQPANKNSATMPKYRINECLGNLTHVRKRGEWINLILQQLGIARSTFYKYCAIRQDEKQEIPATQFLKLAKLFNVPPETLLTSPVDCGPIAEAEAEKPA